MDSFSQFIYGRLAARSENGRWVSYVANERGTELQIISYKSLKVSARFDFSSFRINATKNDRNPKFKNQVSTPKSKNARGGEIIRQLLWSGRVCWIRTQSGNLFIVYIEQTAAGLEWVLMPVKSNATTIDSTDPFATPLPCSHLSRLPSGYIMEFSDHQVYGAIRNPSAAPLFFKNVKGPKVASLSPDEKYLAIGTRTDCVDFISILNCRSWNVLLTFEVPTRDLHAIHWSPDKSALIVADTPLAGQTFVYRLDGQLKCIINQHEDGMNIKSLAMSTRLTTESILRQHLLAIGNFDQKIRLYNPFNGGIVGKLCHESVLRKNASLTVYVETEVVESIDLKTKGFRVCKHRKYDVDESEVVHVPTSTIDYNNNEANSVPSIGVSFVAFCPAGKLLATKNDNMPNVVWIWDVSSLYSREVTFRELTEDTCSSVSPMVVLIHKEAVSDLSWEIKERPDEDGNTPAPSSTLDEERRRYRLAIATGSNSLYLWCDLGASAINLSTDSLEKFSVHKLIWTTPNTILLKDQNKFCLAYPPELVEEDGASINGSVIEQSTAKPYDDDPDHVRDYKPDVEDSFDNSPMKEHYYDGDSIIDQSIGDYDDSNDGDNTDQVPVDEFDGGDEE